MIDTHTCVFIANHELAGAQCEGDRSVDRGQAAGFGLLAVVVCDIATGAWSWETAV
jgi:hypothetical protein